MKENSRPIRKPRNLITEYWDDLEYFLNAAEIEEAKRNEYNQIYKIAVGELPAGNDIKTKIPELPVFDKRNIKFSILSAFLFLEAFINAEYFDHMKLSLQDLNQTQKRNLDKELSKTLFTEKWSRWIADFIGAEKMSFINDQEWKEMENLKKWRNQLVHYKIHELMHVAHDVLTIKNAREAKKITTNIIIWYYQKTEIAVPDWIKRDIVKC